MVMVFNVALFVNDKSHFFLSSALTGRDKALDQLNRQIAELADMLALERQQNTDLRANVDDLSSELTKSTAARDALNQRLTVIIGERDAAIAKLADANARIAASSTAKTDVDARLEDASKAAE